MLVLGIESSCDETGLALYDSDLGLLTQALHSQVALHADYGGVVPELASRDHVRKITPLTHRVLSDAGTHVNVTLCFTAGQALLAAKAGAKFISPFVGRLDDIGQDGMDLIKKICSIYSNYDFDTKVLVASVRSTSHVVDAALMGADVVTLPPKILTALYNHPLTESGLDAFLKDWQATGQSIL